MGTGGEPGDGERGAAERAADHADVLHARVSNGQVRPGRRQVHGRVPAVQGRRRPEGRQRRHRGNQAEEDDRLCHLVPDRIQGQYISDYFLSYMLWRKQAWSRVINRVQMSIMYQEV